MASLNSSCLIKDSSAYITAIYAHAPTCKHIQGHIPHTHACTHGRTHGRTLARTHARTHTHIYGYLWLASACPVTWCKNGGTLTKDCLCRCRGGWTGGDCGGMWLLHVFSSWFCYRVITGRSHPRLESLHQQRVL